MDKKDTKREREQIIEYCKRSGYYLLSQYHFEPNTDVFLGRIIKDLSYQK